MRHVLPLLLFALPYCGVNAQLTGPVDVPSRGFSFRIPAGWNGLEQQGTWGLVNDEVPGTLVITTHEHKDLKALEQDMRAVESDDPANQLTVQGRSGNPLPNAVLLEFGGTMEWQPVHLLGIGMISDAGGPGISIIALASGTALGAPLREAALAVMHSVRFIAPVIPPLVDQWRTHLTATRLTYISSYSSTPGAATDLGGGRSDTRLLDLCPEGWYSLAYGTDLTLGGADASAAAASSGTETGTWEVLTNTLEGARLELRSNDGMIRSYPLEDRNGATYLDGERWFRTTAVDGDHAPACDP